MRSRSFSLYGNCIPISGFKESLICDLERCCYLPISNHLFEIVKSNHSSRSSIKQLKNFYKHSSDEGIDRLFDYLVDNEYGFYNYEPELFPIVSLEWDSPYALTNAVVEIDCYNKERVRNVLTELIEIGCHAVDLIFIDPFRGDAIDNFIDIIKNSRTSCVNLFMPYSDLLLEDDLRRLFFSNSIIGNIVIYKSPNNCYGDTILPDVFNKRIIFTIKDITKNLSINGGVLGMVLNISSFTEAYKYNLALNRKVCINAKGEIKNYLTHSTSYGTIEDVELKEVLKNEEFKKIWYVSKDKIENCKVCQYRYFCVDFSDIVEVSGFYSTINKCTYNPYIAKWPGEDGYVPVEECGTYSRETGFIVNQERVDELNAQISGE